MSRLAIEGMSELQVLTRFDELDTDRIWGPDPAQFEAPPQSDGSVVLVGGISSGVPFGRVSPTPGAGGQVALNGSVANPDANTHAYLASVTGDGIPGGRQDINSPGLTTLSARTAATPIPIPGVLLPGQELVAQAGDVYSEAGQFLTQTTWWSCVLQEDPPVSGFNFGALWGVLSDASPVVLDGPDGTIFKRRRVMWGVNPTTPGSFIINRDSDPHFIGLYLIDPVAGNTLISVKEVEPEETFNQPGSSGVGGGGWIDLTEGQALRVVDITGQGEGELPLVHFSYIDFIDEDKQLVFPANLPNAPDPFEATPP